MIIVFIELDGVVIGFVWSVDGFDLYGVFDGCFDLLICFGGYYYVVGFSLLVENILEFCWCFNSIVVGIIFMGNCEEMLCI